MNSNIQKVKNLAISSSLFQNPKISYLAEGYGNINYLVSEKDNKYVLRIKKSKEDQFKDSLEREYVFLSYFWEKGIKFVPKPIYFSSKDNFLIESYLEGEEVRIENFNDNQLKNFAKNYIELFNLDINEFYTFCRKNNLKKFEPSSEKEALEKYGFKRFKSVEQAKHVPQEIKKWTKLALNNNLSSINSIEKNKAKGFNCGDPESKVILFNDVPQFYDFEHANIYSGRGLSYLKIHSKISLIKFHKLLNFYSEYSGVSKETLEEEINFEERLIRVNDVVWALMNWAEAESEEDKKFFRNLSYERKKLVEELEN